MTQEAYRVWQYLIRTYGHLSQRGRMIDSVRAESLSSAIELLRLANIEVTDQEETARFPRRTAAH